MSNNAPRVQEQALRDFATRLLQAEGLLAGHAEQVAQVLVWADLRGVATHGVSRLPLYLRWLGSGEMNRHAEVRSMLRLPALEILDGDRCPGAVGMLQAVRTAADLARRSGVGLALLRQTTHTGALGYYTAALADAGMAGWATVASGPNMGYHGASVPAVSTAPLSMAMPSAGHASVVLDMAAGAISVGALMQARSTGAVLDAGVAMDSQGLPTCDPQAAQAPLPLGGPKGSGLALMSELLCSVLAGAPILVPALQARPEAVPHTQNAMVLAIDVAQLGNVAAMGEQIESLKRALKDLPAAHGSEVMLPGERGDRARDIHLADGIALPEGIRSELALAASVRGIAVPW